MFRNICLDVARVNRDPTARLRIVEAGVTAVAAHGVRAATIRLIAAEAGVSTGFITHYFAGKDELVEAVLELTNRRAAARVRALEIHLIANIY